MTVRYPFNIHMLGRATKMIDSESLVQEVQKIKSKRLGRPPDSSRVIDESTSEILAMRREIAAEVMRDMLLEILGEVVSINDNSIPVLLKALASKLENI